MTASHPLFLLAAALTSISACVSGTRPVPRGSPSGAHGRNDLITRADLRNLRTAWTVGDVIQQLRPEFLYPVTVLGSAGPQRTFPAIYVNDQFLGDVDELNVLSAENFIEARRLGAAEARGTFGPLCRCAGGVIAVRTATYLSRKQL